MTDLRVQEVISKLQKMAEALSGRLLVDDLAREAVEVCKDIMGADACSIFVFEDPEPEKPRRLLMRASRGYANDLAGRADYFVGKDVPIKSLGVTGWIALKGETFSTNKRADFKNCPGYSGKYDVELWGEDARNLCESFFGAPLKTWEKIYGVLKVESQKTDYFGMSQQNILGIIASMISSSLHNLTSVRLLHSLFADIGSYPTNFKKLYSLLSRICSELVHAEACSIFIPNVVGRLVMRGDFGHDVSFVDDDSFANTYGPNEGITGTVYSTGVPSIVSSKREINQLPYHKSKLYPRQWKEGTKHVCHSWYQFPIGKDKPALGVMKIENKLGKDGMPIKESGFCVPERQLLEILANSALSLIVARNAEISAKHAHTALRSHFRVVHIDEVLSPGVIDGIERLRNVKNPNLHEKIKEFIKDVKKKRTEPSVDDLSFAKGWIGTFGDALGLKEEFLRYSHSLHGFEPLLFQVPGYRSHYVHQLNVFLNGYLILNWLDRRQFSYLRKVVSHKCNKSKADVDILKIWFITAVFHDTGYPVGKVGELTEVLAKRIFNKDYSDIGPEVVERVSYRLFRATFRESLGSLLRFLSDWLKTSDESEKERRLCGIIHELFFKGLSESLIAGLILMKAAEEANLESQTLSTAASAIVLDDWDIWEALTREKIITEFSYAEHPIAFLLVYCDNIQEYGRFRNAGEMMPVDFGASMVKGQTLEFSSGKDSMSCRLDYASKPENWEEKVKPQLESMKGFWKSPSDVEFKISYAIKGQSGEFDKLVFLKGSNGSR